MRNILPLTALRAFFALWVLAFHWFFLYPVASTPFFDLGFSTPLFDRGYLGVDGFFVLSGFILAYNYEQVGRLFDYRDFVVNRIARIYPVHIVCLILALVRILVKEVVAHRQIIGTPGNTWADLAANIFLVNSWFSWQKNGWNDVAWSVSAEWFAYLVFPAFAVASRLKRPLATTFAMVATLLTLYWVEATNGSSHLSNPHGLSRLIPEFYLGSLACALRRQVPWLAAMRSGSVVSLALVALGLLSHLDTLAVAGLAALILALASERDLLRQAMSIRPMIYLGEISYCLYLVQRAPQNLWDLLREKIPGVIAMPIAASIVALLALCICSAAMLHHFVENPARRFVKQLFCRAASKERTAHNTA